MNLVGTKTQFTDEKILTDANLRKQQKEQYTQVTFVSMYNILHQGNGVFKCKAKAVTSGQEVDNNWA